MPSHRFQELILADGADVFGPYNAVFAEAGFSGTQQQVPGAKLLNGSRERNGEHAVCARMLVAAILGDDHGWPVLAGGIGGKMCPPDLPAQWRARLLRVQSGIPINMLGPVICAHSRCSANSASEAVS